MIVTIKDISQDWLKQNYTYVEGTLISTVKGIKQRVDKEHKRSGYSRVSIYGKPYLTHQLIFLMFHGYLPEEIDHIDCNKLNNKISNLRPTTKSQNQWNRNNYSSNRTGVKGVGLDKSTSKFRARCQVNGKQYYLGLFKTVSEAEKVVKDFRTEHHKEYARHE